MDSNQPLKVIRNRHTDREETELLSPGEGVGFGGGQGVNLYLDIPEGSYVEIRHGAATDDDGVFIPTKLWANILFLLNIVEKEAQQCVKSSHHEEPLLGHAYMLLRDDVYRLRRELAEANGELPE
jgi:hypothetical protein